MLCAEPFRGSDGCLRQHFLPSQISEGFFGGNLQYLHSASPGSRSPGSSSSAHPQLQLQINLDSKKPREGARRVRPCSSPKMDFKAAPTLPALAGRGGNVGGRGVAIPACILMFHPSAHPEHITAFSVEINSNRGFFVDFRASRLKVICVLFDFFL